MEFRKAVDGRAAFLMLVLCSLWGLQQVAIKAAAPDVAPVFQIALRSGIAALLTASLMLLRRESLTLRDGTWRAGLLVGFLFGIEFLLIGEGLRYTSAARMVVFLYTAPVFAALGLHAALQNERLRPLQWIGIAVAFVGIAAAFSGRGEPPATGVDPLWGDLFGLLAGMAWGATTVVVRSSRLSQASAARTLLYQLVGAFVIALVAAIVSGQTGFRPTLIAWTSVAFQGVIVSFASYLVWFWLLRHYLASRLGVLSFMTPLFGVGFGVWLLREPLHPNFLVGASLVLVGILLVSGHEWLKQGWARAAG